MDLWFTEGKEETPDGLIKRVVSITEAVSESPDQNCEWFKLLLNQYLKPGDEVSHPGKFIPLCVNFNTFV